MRLILGLLACLVLSACGASVPSQNTVSAGSGAVEVGPEPSLDPAYQLGSGDQLRVIVFGEENLSGEFLVDGGGTVSMPLIGELEAAGKTVQQFRVELEQRLSNGYLTNPRVSAEVLNYRPFYILGEVEESGEYPFSDGLTVMNAVARAGGFTYRANTRVVFIQRAGTSSEVETPLSPLLRVMPGDTIRIGERFF